VFGGNGVSGTASYVASTRTLTFVNGTGGAKAFPLGIAGLNIAWNGAFFGVQSVAPDGGTIVLQASGTNVANAPPVNISAQKFLIYPTIAKIDGSGFAVVTGLSADKQTPVYTYLSVGEVTRSTIKSSGITLSNTKSSHR
jgi:hypothetical protein